MSFDLMVTQTIINTIHHTVREQSGVNTLMCFLWSDRYVRIYMYKQICTYIHVQIDMHVYTLADSTGVSDIEGYQQHPHAVNLGSGSESR